MVFYIIVDKNEKQYMLLGVFLLAHLLNGRCFLQSLIILLQRAGRYLVQLQLPDDRLDIIPDQACVAGIHGNRPFRLTVQLHILIQKLRDCAAFRDGKAAGHLIVFDLCFAFLGILHGGIGFPLLMLFSACVGIGVHDAKPVSAWNNRSHRQSSFS